MISISIYALYICTCIDLYTYIYLSIYIYIYSCWYWTWYIGILVGFSECINSVWASLLPIEVAKKILTEQSPRMAMEVNGSVEGKICRIFLISWGNPWENPWFLVQILLLNHWTMVCGWNVPFERVELRVFIIALGTRVVMSGGNKLCRWRWGETFTSSSLLACHQILSWRRFASWKISLGDLSNLSGGWNVCTDLVLQKWFIFILEVTNWVGNSFFIHNQRREFSSLHKFQELLLKLVAELKNDTVKQKAGHIVNPEANFNPSSGLLA